MQTSSTDDGVARAPLPIDCLENTGMLPRSVFCPITNAPMGDPVLRVVDPYGLYGLPRRISYSFVRYIRGTFLFVRGCLAAMVGGLLDPPL